MKKYLFGFLILMPLSGYSMKPGGIYFSGNSLDVEKGSLIARNGPVHIEMTQNVNLDHAKIFGDRVDMEIGQRLLNRASQIGAKTVIYIEADEQTNETVINKWSHDWRSGDNYVHTEGIESIDDCSFLAPIVIQKGTKIRNLGIAVNAKIFEDQGIDTLNMPASVVLHNYAHFEKSGLFGSASSDTRQLDDFHVPTRYHVEYFKSLGQEGKETRIGLGYTLIQAGSDIIITKSTKEDIPVDERHILEIHEEKSGISFFGGMSVPNSLAQLQSMRQAYQSGNMMGFTTSAIGAIAKGIRVCETAKTIGDAVKNFKGFNGVSDIKMADIGSMIGVISQFVNGPSIQIGTFSLDIKQEEHITRGNCMKAGRNMIFHNDEKSSFCGHYEAGNDIDIKTKTFVTYAMPHTKTSSVSVHQSGVSMDLLSFAGSLMSGGMAAMNNALLMSSSVNISSQNTRTHAVQYLPTTIQAKKKLNIEAKDGYITQAQIKAALVHAVFTGDTVIETLADEMKSESTGYGISMGLGMFADGKTDGEDKSVVTSKNNGFMDFVGNLKDYVKYVGISGVHSSEFERKIDDYAEFVGTENFYLKVGGILTEKSAFFGYVGQDKSQEHIEAKKIHHEKVPEFHSKNDSSFQVHFGDVFAVYDALHKFIKDDDPPALLESDEEREDREERNDILEDWAENEVDQLVDDEEMSENEAFEEVKKKVPVIKEKVKIRQKLNKEDSNEEKVKVITEEIKKANKEHAELTKNTSEDKTEKNSYTEKKKILEEKYKEIFGQLALLEKKEKKESADNAVKTRKEYVFASLDTETLDYIDDFNNIPLSDEDVIRREAEESVSKRYNEIRAEAAADYQAQCRFLNGEGYVSGSLIRRDNSDEARLERLYQDELSKIGKSDIQNALRFIPILGSCMDAYYGDTSATEFLGALAFDVGASFLPIGKIATVGKQGVRKFTAKLLGNGKIECEVVSKAKPKIKSGTRSCNAATMQNPEIITSRGGAYSKLEGKTAEGISCDRHHVIADSISPIPRNEGPCIQMTRGDHMKTSSYGNSSAARAYRKEVKDMIDNGNIRDAMAKEIWDVKKATGKKYNSGLTEALDYAKSKGYIPRKPK